jgi:hypothetical protein
MVFTVRSARHGLAMLATFAVVAAVSTAPAQADDGPITTLAGTTAGVAGDGGPATQAQLSGPRAAALAPDGRLLIADAANNRVRLVGSDGTINTVAQVAPRQGPNPATQLDGAPTGVAFTPGGISLVSDGVGGYVGRINTPPGGPATVTPLIGTRESPGFAGDGGPSNVARLNQPTGLFVASDGTIYIADTGNNRIRKVTPAGIISTVAGSSGAGFSGDGGAATAATLNGPRGVALGADGALLIADTGNNRIRRVAVDGTISTVAGGGATGFDGDGLPATLAKITSPASVTPLRLGGFVITDTGNNRIRRVTPLGTIFTIAGSDPGLAGDGGPASAARLSAPQSVAITPSGGFLVADTGNSRIRLLASDGVLPNPIPGRTLRIAKSSGFVQALVPGRAASLPIREPDLTVLGTQADAEKGTVLVQTGTDQGTIRNAEISEGKFSITQPSGPGTTMFKLTAAMNGCRRLEGGLTAGAAKVKPKKKRKRRSRKIFIHADAGTDTGGRYADAAVRGTSWTIQDYCTQTRVTVRTGLVAVRDRVKGKTVLVPAGQHYTARRPKS